MTMPAPSPKLAATVARVRSTGNAVETCECPSAVTSARPPTNAMKNPAAKRGAAGCRLDSAPPIPSWRKHMPLGRTTYRPQLPRPMPVHKEQEQRALLSAFCFADGPNLRGSGHSRAPTVRSARSTSRARATRVVTSIL
jgi:hypothetical protein